MVVAVDYVQGADMLAPGLARAEGPVLRGLEQDGRFSMRPIRYDSLEGRHLFPYMYGPLPISLHRGAADLIHIANIWYAHLVLTTYRPTIVTCHDLIEIGKAPPEAPRAKPHRQLHYRAIRWGAARASHVLCDSAATEQKLLTTIPACFGKTSVVYLGLDQSFQPGPTDESVLAHLGVTRPYVLYVGSEQSRKNVPALVRAVSVAGRSIPGLALVKVGKSQTEEGRDAFLQALRESNLEARTRILESISDAQLVHLYRGAAVLALVSLEEGFGYPPLEAMGCGCPTVVSDRDSLPEVVGEAGLVVDPQNEPEIARAMVAATTDTDLRARLVAQGHERAARFGWDETVRQVAATYESVLAGR